MKKKRILAMILALSLLMGQTVYAQESGPVPEEKLFVQDVSDVEGYSSDKAVSTATITSKESYSDAFEVLELVNEEREKEGLDALTMDRDLLEAAMLRGSELGLYFSHTRPTDMDCFTACDKMYGENIAAGQGSPARVMESWMNSDGHRGNILDEDYQSIGIGAVTIDGVAYWVQCFGLDEADSVSEASYTDSVVVRDVQFDANFDELDYGISVDTTTLDVGETASVEFYFHNDFTTTYIEPDYLNYESSDSLVCTVEDGRITAVGNGSADITVSLLKSPEVAFSTTIKVNPHEYGEPEWTWSDDYTAATATFTCTCGENHVETVEATVTSETTAATCEEAGKTVYTAACEFEGETYTDTQEVQIDALGHDYDEPTWTWSEDYLTATATFTCAKDETHVKVVEAAVTSESSDATCETAGTVTYIAAVKLEGKTYTDVKTVEGQALGHDYGEPTWEWSEDDIEATAVFTCANDETHVEKVTAAVTSETYDAECEKDGEIVYTAVCEFNDQEYSDQKKEVIPAPGHDYGEPEWVWAEDYSTAKANFTCSNNPQHVETVVAVITKEIDREAEKTIYTATATLDGREYTDVQEVEGIPDADMNPFVDVSEDDYYYDAVLWAFNNNITTGYDETHFAPLEDCTRAQVVTFLWRAVGEPEPETAKQPFVDVAEDDYYCKAVLWAYEKGITTGKDATHFVPNEKVSREQFVTFLYRQKGEPAYTAENPFVDVQEGTFYYDAILWAYENGITTGTDATHFSPAAICIRGDVVTFLYRAYGEDE